MNKGLRAFLLIVALLLYLGGVWIFVIPTVETIVQDVGTAKSADTFVEKTEELRVQYSRYKTAAEKYVKAQQEAHSDPQPAIPSQEGQEPTQSQTEAQQPGQTQQTEEITIPEEISRTMPYEALYKAMKAYNERISDNQQAALNDVFSFSEADFDPALYGVKDGVVASVYIGGLDKSFPVYIGATPSHLSSGVAILSNTSMPTGGANTNTVIAGHRGWSNGKFLKDIEKVKPGTDVVLTTIWEVLRYKVKEIRVIMPYELENIMIQKGRELLTIATCHPYGSGGRMYRYLVICERVFPEEGAQTEQTAETKSETETPTEEQPAIPAAASSVPPEEIPTGQKAGAEITQDGFHETPALQVPINVSREVEYESSGTEILVTDILTYAGLVLFVLFPIFAAVMLLKKPKRK